jgi:hypothetical protein
MPRHNVVRRNALATLAIATLAAASGCKSHQPPPGAAIPDSAAATPPAPPPPSPSTSSTTGAHAMDPHSMSQAELQFGVSPTRSDAVTYQPNVVLMEQGAQAIRSVSPDGLTWTFDASAPHANEIDTGKVLFATSRAVGRVLAVTHTGGTLSVILGPVEITDVIKEADISYDQPVDLQSMVAYSAPNYPGAIDEMSKLTADADDGDGGGDGTSVTTAVLSPSGDVRPIAYVSGDAWTDADVARFRSMQASASPVPGVGPPSQTTIGDFQTIPFCCGGLGIKLLHNGDDIKVLAYAVLRLDKPSLQFNLKIHGGQVQTAKIVLNGAAGLTVHLETATAQGIDGNINKKFYVPVDLSIPIAGLPVPFAVTLHQQLLIQTAFTAKNSTLNSTGDYAFAGQIYMGLDNGNWGVGAPTSLHTNTSLGQSLDGLSLGATGMVFGMEGRIIVGIGAFGFVTGPYLGYAAVVGLTRGSDQTKMLVGVTCRGTVLDPSLEVGIGYQVPAPVTKAINAILKTLNLAPIQGSGGLKHNENLLHKAEDNPKHCAGY